MEITKGPKQTAGTDANKQKGKHNRQMVRGTH